MQRVVEIVNEPGASGASDVLSMDHDERYVRRRVCTTLHGEKVLIDLPDARQLAHGDVLVLEDGGRIEVVATEEDLLEVRPGPDKSIVHLAWHLGNRHLAAQIEPDRILIQHDHVIADMLKVLGAVVHSVREPFQPERGAYHKHPHN